MLFPLPGWSVTGGHRLTEPRMENEENLFLMQQVVMVGNTLVKKRVLRVASIGFGRKLDNYSK